MSGKIVVKKPFTAKSTAASGTSTSSSYFLAWEIEGYFGLQANISGDGTAKIEYQLSNDGVTFSEPEGASDVATGLVKTSGPASDGNVYIGFEPKLAKYIRLKITETGGANAVVITAHLAIH